jgi:hypothetical protein
MQREERDEVLCRVRDVESLGVDPHAKSTEQVQRDGGGRIAGFPSRGPFRPSVPFVTLRGLMVTYAMFRSRRTCVAAAFVLRRGEIVYLRTAGLSLYQ